MKLPVVWHEKYEVDLGPHVFVTAKYRLVKQRLLAEGVIRRSELVRPSPASDEDLRLVHTESYLEKIRTGSFAHHERVALEVPFSSELREAAWICCGGTILAGRLALEARAADPAAPAVAVHLGGGFHHAFPDHGEGFCLVNDVAVAIRRLQADGAIRRLLVIDLDVHHGNGTAAIFSRDPEVFTFSMHQQFLYPLAKPPGDLDIGLPDGTDDAGYLGRLREHLPGIVARHRPELSFYLAGADPYREDQLGGLALTREGLRRRDAYVLGLLAEAGIPVVVLLAGGYAWELAQTVEIHCNTVRAAADTLRSVKRGCEKR